jgi:hypothetical protein
MVVWFVRGLQRGVVTTRYPAAPPDAWTTSLPTPPTIDADELSSTVAAMLEAVCPSGAFRCGTRELIYDVGACTACRRCLRAAPEVMHPSGQFLLAATKRDHLIKRIPLHQEPQQHGSGDRR